MSEGTQRRLAAIVSADVVGYSRLMGVDEAGTHERLQARFRDFVQPKIIEHRGRVVKLMGDGLLAEFPSVIDAVNWSLEVQAMVAELENETAADKRIEYRVGVNLGDIIVDGDDIFGDGVNVAARLQEIAETGGVCISDKVHTEVRGKVSVEFSDGGAQMVKNISEPVHVWRWSPNQQATAKPVVTGPDEPLSLPDKPSIAVLPFDNMSNDPEQEYFADGMTEDIITALSKVRWLFVIARNSTFTYKGQAIDVTRVSQELGVRYVLEGSIRKAGNRVRITAQLIDATNGNHVWAERYDRGIEDVFTLQDEMTQTIVSAIEPELGNVERERILRKPPESLGAWESHQRGMWHIWRSTREDVDKAEVFFRRALELTPDFGAAWAGLAYVNYEWVLYNFGVKDGMPRDEILQQGVEYGRKAIAADERDFFAHIALARVLTLMGEFEEATEQSRLALDLNPNSAHAHHALGAVYCYAGRPKEAIEEFETVLRLSPIDPHRWASKSLMAMSHYFLRDYKLAEEWARSSVRDHPRMYWSYVYLAVALSRQERIGEAKKVFADLLKIKPDFSVAAIDYALPIKQESDRRLVIESMRELGLPEE
jgi:adenylate cyclase